MAGGFPNEIKTKIRYLIAFVVIIILSYENMITTNYKISEITSS